MEDFKLDKYKKLDLEKAILMKKIAKNFINNFKQIEESGSGVYFYSNSINTGKTMLACIIANHLIESENIEIKFTTMDSLLKSIKSTYSENNKNEYNILEYYNNIRLLIIDELNNNYNNFGLNNLHNILNHRFNNNKATILTSNYSIKSLFNLTDNKLKDKIKSNLNNNILEYQFPETEIKDKSEVIKKIGDLLNN